MHYSGEPRGGGPSIISCTQHQDERIRSCHALFFRVRARLSTRAVARVSDGFSLRVLMVA
jgi:hypothetical protein